MTPSVHGLNKIEHGHLIPLARNGTQLRGYATFAPPNAHAAALQSRDQTIVDREAGLNCCNDGSLLTTFVCNPGEHILPSLGIMAMSLAPTEIVAPSHYPPPLLLPERSPSRPESLPLAN